MGRARACLAAVPVLVGVAAAQPVITSARTVPQRSDAEVFVVVDTSRSMLASAASGEPTRFERARDEAIALQEELAGRPARDRVVHGPRLPHLFPTVDQRVFRETMREARRDRAPAAVDVVRHERHDARRARCRADARTFFTPAVKKRALVVFTDGESQPVSSVLATDFAKKPRIDVTFVRMGDGERADLGERRRRGRLHARSELRGDARAAAAAVDGRVARGGAGRRGRCGRTRGARDRPDDRPPHRGQPARAHAVRRAARRHPARLRALPAESLRAAKVPRATGRSAAWLARPAGGREVVSSNLAAPTESRTRLLVLRRSSRMGLSGRSRHGPRQEPQQDYTGRHERQADEVVQVHAVTCTQRHREEDRVETVRVEPDDGGPECDRDDSEHPPQGPLSVPSARDLVPARRCDTEVSDRARTKSHRRRAGVWRPPFPLPWGGRWVAGSALSPDAKTSRRLRSENVKSATAGSRRASQEVVPAALGATPRTAAGRICRLRASAPGGSAPCRPRATFAS